MPCSFAGIARNQAEILDLFEQAFLLVIDEETQTARLAISTLPRSPVRTAPVRQQIRDGLHVFRAQMLGQGAIPLDGTAPPKALADSLVAHLAPGNSPSSRPVLSSPVRPLWTSHSCLALPGHSQRRQIVPVRARKYGLARDSVAVHKADLACEAVPTQTTARDEGRWSLTPDPPCLLRAACQWCMRRRVGAECHWGQLRESVRYGCTCDPGRPIVAVLVMERTVRPSGHD